MHDASTPTLTMVTWHQGPEGFRATMQPKVDHSCAPATYLPKPLEWNICCVPSAATVHGEWLRSIDFFWQSYKSHLQLWCRFIHNSFPLHRCLPKMAIYPMPSQWCCTASSSGSGCVHQLPCAPLPRAGSASGAGPPHRHAPGSCLGPSGLRQASAKKTMNLTWKLKRCVMNHLNHGTWNESIAFMERKPKGVQWPNWFVNHLHSKRQCHLKFIESVGSTLKQAEMRMVLHVGIDVPLAVRQVVATLLVGAQHLRCTFTARMGWSWSFPRLPPPGLGPLLLSLPFAFGRPPSPPSIAMVVALVVAIVALVAVAVLPALVLLVSIFCLSLLAFILHEVCQLVPGVIHLFIFLGMQLLLLLVVILLMVRVVTMVCIHVVVTCIFCAIMAIQLDWRIICRLCLLLLFLVVFYLGIMFAIPIISCSAIPIISLSTRRVCTLLPPCSLLLIVVLHLRIVPLCRRVLVTFRLGHVGLAQQLEEFASRAHGAQRVALVTGNSVL